MRKLALLQHSDQASLLWYLAITMACCWGGLFYLLYRALW